MSNVTGNWISDEQATSARYWGEHLRSAVRFSDGVVQLHKEKSAVFIEVGPGNTLTTLARQCQSPELTAPVVASLPAAKTQLPALDHLLLAMGRVWLTGVKLDWKKLHGDTTRFRLSLPTYPFERKRYWLDGAKDSNQETSTTGMAADAGALHARHIQSAFVAPTSAREWAVSAIWQDLFGIEKVGIYDDFFDMGGDSMLAIQLVARLQSHFEVELPLAEVLQYPTVAEQACRIDEAKQSGGKVANSSPVVRIQPKGSKPPFFCVHPAGGIVHCYIELARLLGKDQPFFALQHPGIDGPCEPYTEFDVMAAYYVEAMQKVQPEGPYYIGGWSFGGTVAYEMAQQLQAMGEEVAMLVMMDTPAPTSVYDKTKLREEFDATGIFTFLGRGIGQIFGNSLTIDPTNLERLTTDEQFDLVLNEAGSINDMSGKEEARAQLAQIIEMFKVADRAERNYCPAPYNGEITMLRVAGLDDYEFTGYKHHPGIDTPSFGWDRCAKTVNVCPVPGTHMTMVVNPHVRQLAQALSGCLQQAQAAHQLEDELVL